jgi:hypothetical protein
MTTRNTGDVGSVGPKPRVVPPVRRTTTPPNYDVGAHRTLLTDVDETPWGVGDGVRGNPSVPWGDVGMGDASTIYNNNVPGTWEIWKVGEETLVIWQLPVAKDANGEVTDTVPLAFRINAEQLAQWGSNPTPTQTISEAQFNQAGGLEMGDFGDIDNPDQDPFQGFLDKMEEQSTIFPWLMDPEILALSGAALLEGRALSEAELAGTNWWQAHNAGQRQWLVLASSDPSSALQLRGDNRISVLDSLKEAGVSNADQLTATIDGSEVNLSEYFADQRTEGNWSDTYLQNQINLLANGESGLDLGGGVPDTNLSRVGRVRELYNTWLGPLFGQVSDATARDWARKLRENPDGEDTLLEFLKDARMAQLPQYGDREVSYQAIAEPYRNLLGSRWGQAADEMDPFFIDLIKTNDVTTADRTLRKVGIQKNVGAVRDQLTKDLMDSFGGNVVRTA